MFAVCSGWIAQLWGEQNTKVTLPPDDMSDLSKGKKKKKRFKDCTRLPSPASLFSPNCFPLAQWIGCTYIFINRKKCYANTFLKKRNVKWKMRMTLQRISMEEEESQVWAVQGSGHRSCPTTMRLFMWRQWLTLHWALGKAKPSIFLTRFHQRSRTNPHDHPSLCSWKEWVNSSQNPTKDCCDGRAILEWQSGFSCQQCSHIY